jgi:hypothetical protein
MVSDINRAKTYSPQKGREVEKAIGELDKTMAAAAASHMC